MNTLSVTERSRAMERFMLNLLGMIMTLHNETENVILPDDLRIAG